MNNDLTNEVVGFYEGPGKTGEQYTIRLKVPVVAEFLSFQLKGKKQYLQIEGIRLNEQPALGEYKLNFTLDYIIHQRWGRLFSKKIGPPPERYLNLPPIYQFFCYRISRIAYVLI